MNKTQAVKAAFVLSCALLGTLASCDSQEPGQVQLPVVIDSTHALSATTDLGYRVEVTRLRVAVADLALTTSGEMHTAWLDRIERLFVSEAWAHPGHFAGGEVIGELPGRFILDFAADDGAVLGMADLLVGDYNGANLTFIQAGVADGIEADDPLSGHTIAIEGTASRDGSSFTFSALIDQDADRQVIGLPFNLEVAAGTGDVLGLQLLLNDPVEGVTVFDGIDFDGLDSDGDGVVDLSPETPEYNRLRRVLQVHSHYALVPTQGDVGAEKP